jgi:integrase
MEEKNLLTLSQLASILQINESALSILAGSGQIPCTNIKGHSPGTVSPHFNPDVITDWLNGGPVLKTMNDKAYIEYLRELYRKKFPDALKELKDFSAQFSDSREPKRYSFIKIKNKKMGFKYYVRYIENGKLVRSSWCTHTNNLEFAIQFAIENRERILAEYHNRKKQRKVTSELYDLMQGYYSKNSVHLQEDTRRGRSLCDKAIKTYNNFMNKKWVPYLKENNIKKIDEIDTPLLARFQDKLLAGGIKPQTINHYLSYISMVFDHLVTEGGANYNPVSNLVKLKISEDSVEIRGCYDTGDLSGVFSKRWKNKTSRLLCLLIYTTNMRNIEIERMQVSDIVKIDKYDFINIPKSKSKNGVRVVPLHDIVYRTLMKHIKQNDKEGDDFVFKKNHINHMQTSVWHDAYVEMGELLGYDEEKLKEENITFYSGRHFWKTLMNSENLGDAEEVFMGHKVTEDVAKRYNHRDKQGKEKIVKKAEEVFKILDKRVFNRKAAGSGRKPGK